MHDIMHDLAKFVAGEFYFRSEELGNEDKMSVMTRHLSYGRLSHPISKNRDVMGGLKSLRTFMSINFLPPPFNIESIASDFLSKLKCLKEMPRGMRKLINLQVLSEFVVGKHAENGIKELGALSNLHGSLNIEKLENVFDGSEASKARIIDKTHIKKLRLEWSKDGDMVSSTQSERDIFDKLQPHKDLQRLTINGYRGTLFPDWVGHSSYQNMTDLYLGYCSNCCMLPSLGQLPSLKRLEIEDFNELENIGVEFYKNDNDHTSLAAPFPSLEDLTFRGMSCWEVWHPCESNAFPQLKHLEIRDCPKFRGDLSNQVPALETIQIVKCDELVSSLPKAPAIRDLSITKSDKVSLQDIPLSLQFLSIEGYLVKSVFQSMAINEPTCLQSLHISNCKSSISFPGDRIPVSSLKTLTIDGCRKLEFPMKQHHELLQLLQIVNSCDSLTSFPLEIFPNLDSLKFKSCENLESLSVPQSWDAALLNLQMTSLRVSNCDKLKSLPCHMSTLLPKLEDLSIAGCPEIDSFPDGVLPPNLKSLSMGNCEKLLSALSSIAVHEGITHLRIESQYGESVKSFPKEGLLRQLPFLTNLCLYELPNIETLDCKELLHLTSLQELQIYKCLKLENMIGERLPPSLIKLEIYRCPLLEERCQMKHPQIWPKISHIPGVRVDGRWIK